MEQGCRIGRWRPAELAVEGGAGSERCRGARHSEDGNKNRLHVLDAHCVLRAWSSESGEATAARIGAIEATVTRPCPVTVA